MQEKIEAAIITIGDELLIGQTIDTNSSFISQQLNKNGIWVNKKITVGDAWDDIWAVLDTEIKQHRIIILTGGLGPTADDITKPLLCSYFSDELVLNQQVLAHINYLFHHVYLKTGDLPESSRQQAMLPSSCIALHNKTGSAAGMWFEKKGHIIIALPGVPTEMQSILTEEAIPRLSSYFTLPIVYHKTLLTIGYAESLIETKLQPIIKEMPQHIKLAYLPSFGQVKLRLTALGSSKIETENGVDFFAKQIKQYLGNWVASDKYETLEETIGDILTAHNLTISTAESCTGGSIASMITSVAGSSVYFKGSIVSYANEAKQELLNVAAETLNLYGAVSEQVVTAMATNALKIFKTDYAIATSGIMGPGGGSAEKPVGTVWIACANIHEVKTKLLTLGFSRSRNTLQASIAALNFLRLCLSANGAAAGQESA